MHNQDANIFQNNISQRMLPHWSQDVLPWVCAKCISLTGTNCCPSTQTYMFSKIPIWNTFLEYQSVEIANDVGDDERKNKL